MRRKKLIMGAVLLVCSSTCFQSCIGSFALTNKILTWNRQVGNKFVNELVFFAFWILPVYEVTSIADLLVINSIEFWSGNNPLEANNRVIDTDQGEYRILADKTGYKIKSPNGDVLNFEFDESTQTWSFAKNDEDKIDFLKFENDDHVKILDKNGEFVDVELTREGIDNYKSEMMRPLMANL